MAFLRTKDGVSLHYEIHDYTDPWTEAPTLILQHGFGRSARFWYNMIPYLSRTFKVVCPTLRGLGDSGSDFDFKKPITLEAYLADLDAIVNELGVKSVHYVGESLGGILGFAFAAEYPARVRTLSVLSAPLFINPGVEKTFSFGYSSWKEALKTLGSYEWGRKANSATRFPPGTDPDLLEWYARETGKNRVAAMVAMAEIANSAEATPYLERIQAPVLGLYPTAGMVATDEQSRTLKAKVRNLQLIHLPTTYHMIWVLYPAVCARHILYFIAAHEGIACRD
jgi:3-oxoadipate enol-lactonase